MSGFNQDLLNEVTGIARGIVGTVNAASGLVNSVSDVIAGANGGGSSGLPNAVLRDYTHAAKTFRTNSYQYAPKLKFLFHTYFELNASAGEQTNFGLLVKEIKLPQFNFGNYTMNQYNRKRIIQTKIKYEPIEISFHDDNGNQATKLWEAYYRYYYNDTAKPGSVLSSGGGGVQSNATNYNTRNIYKESITGDDDWGFSGGQNDSSGVKKPFFKNITVFGFNQHNFTAYTLINPVITSFGHDTYNYAESGGTMSNRMTIDYETVVYNYGALDGRSPGNIVSGFGDQAHYDTNPSPIVGQGQGTILGQGGLVDAAGGLLQSIEQGNVVAAVASATSAYNTFNQLTAPGNNINIGKEALNALYRTAGINNPVNRNTMFNVPVAASSPGPAGLAGSPTIAATTSPQPITQDAVQTGPDGTQYAATTPTGQIIAPNVSTPAQATLNQVNTTAGVQYSGSNLTAPLPGLTTAAPFNPGNIIA